MARRRYTARYAARRGTVAYMVHPDSNEPLQKTARSALINAMSMNPTRERWPSRVPHWEVEGHWHFVTISYHGSLPVLAKLKLSEIDESLAVLDTQSKEFQQL